MLLGFKDHNLVRPHEQARIEAEPMVRFNRARLRMDAGWKIVNLQFGNRIQFAGYDGIDMGQFCEGDGFDLGLLDEFVPGMKMFIDVVNLSGEARKLRAAMVVTYEPKRRIEAVTIRVDSEGVTVTPDVAPKEP